MKRIIHYLEQIDFFMKNPKEIIKFFRKHLLAFLLFILVFALLYIYIAESGRRKALEKNYTNSKNYIRRLETEIATTKKDFYDLQNQIQKNDSIFYNRSIDLYLDVNTLLDRMSNRFEQDGISAFQDNKPR